MIRELQSRPFARPLLVWTGGIVWQTFFPVPVPAAGCLLLLSAGAVVLSVAAGEGDSRFSYGTRWLWGAAFVPLLLFLSVQRTACSQQGRMPGMVPAGVMRFAQEARSRLLEPTDGLRLTEKEKSVLATLTLGARERMGRDIKERFSVAGVAHILSVSGFHVAVVCSFLAFLLSFLPKRGWGGWSRYSLSVLLLWFFVFMTGLGTASVRAALMLTLYLTGDRMGRQADRYNIWAASAFCMLACDPLLLFDIGFQLSFSAVLSILYFRPRMGQWIRLRNPLLRPVWDGITVTLAAQAGTVFLCLYYFGRFSAVFLFANLPLAFLSSLLIPAGLLWMSLPGWLPGHAALQVVVEWLTRALFNTVDAFSRVPGASVGVPFDSVALSAAYVMALSGVLYCRSGRKVWLFLLLAALLALTVCRLSGKG